LENLQNKEDIFNHISLFGTGISRGCKKPQITSHVSCAIPGIVFRENLKSNSKYPKYFPEAKYLKKSKIWIICISKGADEEVEIYPDHFVKSHRQMTQTETGKPATNCT